MMIESFFNFRIITDMTEEERKKYEQELQAMKEKQKHHETVSYIIYYVHIFLLFSTSFFYR